MSGMRAFKLLSILLAFSTATLIASCDLDSGDTGDPARVVLPPELPVLSSAPLAYVPHGTARVV